MHFSRAILGLSAVFYATVAGAADTSFRTTLDATSRQSGLARSSVPILERAIGRGREVEATSLLQRLSTSRALSARLEGGKTDSSGERTYIQSGNWSIVVAGDGTKAKFRDHEYIKSHPELIRRVEDRMPQPEAEKRAADFIKNELSEFVRVGAHEALVPLKTIYETRQAGNVKLKTSEPVEAVSSTSVFSRTVNGVAVVGPGSKVAITLANDGKVVAFDYDWSDLVETGEQQEVLNVPAINERASALSKLRMRPTTVTVKRFECGYVDLGVRKGRSGGTLQAGCSAQYVGETSTADGNLAFGVADLVPAAVNVLPDRSWPEAQALCVAGDVCKQSDVTPALAPPPSGK